MIWQPIETAPKDGTPIVGFCVHDADPYYISKTELTAYGAHAEGVMHVGDGPHVLVWGGAYDVDPTESVEISEIAGGERRGMMPDWWFRFGSDFEEVANPTHWIPLPKTP